ncbi:MAG: hypothetical protein VKI83_07035 [Synechococcaceae cyanobacterium]|nr:hypothetical protein [Synechococcaceae cyanobacterium]
MSHPLPSPTRHRLRTRIRALPASRRARMLLRVALVVLAIGLLKLLVHHLGLEVISVNPLFSALVASTVFLLGFLLNGVLTDFKESEKLPGEIATALQTLDMEIRGIPAHNPAAQITSHRRAVAAFGATLIGWIEGSVSTAEMRQHFDRCHAVVVDAAALLPPSTLKGRLMGEMASLLRAFNRIETIRETSFVPLVYWLAYAGTTLLCGGLVFAVSSNIREAFFFLCVITFLLIFLLYLINDLDNPFGQGDLDSAEDVSLTVLEEAVVLLGHDLRD